MPNRDVEGGRSLQRARPLVKREPQRVRWQSHYRVQKPLCHFSELSSSLLDEILRWISRLLDEILR